MKKYFLLGLIVAIMPSICFGARSSYTQLVREKQRKMAELEKCMGSTNGLKIAGLSTLGLSAVGVVGNLAEAQKIKEYDEYIEEKVPEAMERIETSIAEEKGKLPPEENANTDSTKRYVVINGKTLPTQIQAKDTSKQPQTVEQIGQDAVFGEKDTDLHFDDNVKAPVQVETNFPLTLDLKTPKADGILMQNIQEVIQTGASEQAEED